LENRCVYDKSITCDFDSNKLCNAVGTGSIMFFPLQSACYCIEFNSSEINNVHEIDSNGEKKQMNLDVFLDNAVSDNVEYKNVFEDINEAKSHYEDFLLVMYSILNEKSYL
jgi:uncharacterized Zn-finger protein